MRTTLTLDDDLGQLLRDRSRLTGTSFRQVVNDAIRSGLQADRQPPHAIPPFRVTPKAAGFRRGIDVLRLNQRNDDLEAEAFELTAATVRGASAGGRRRR